MGILEDEPPGQAGSFKTPKQGVCLFGARWFKFLDFFSPDNLGQLLIVVALSLCKL